MVCLHPKPDKTRTEARAVGTLARERNWHDLVVVTTTQHVTRAGLLFRRCHDGPVSVVGTDLAKGSGGLTARDRVHEWLGLGYALTLGVSC
jgi:uncharacterized SAM-binding protein YcdF (DUF218 family)